MNEILPSPRRVLLPSNLRVLEITCDRCRRHDRHSVTQLVAQHGSKIPVTELLAMLSSNCPREPFAVWRDPCGAHFVGLAPWKLSRRERETGCKRAQELRASPP